jgi:hypothetical protein
MQTYATKRKTKSANARKNGLNNQSLFSYFPVEIGYDVNYNYCCEN